MIFIGCVLKGAELRGSEVDCLITDVAKAAVIEREGFQIGTCPAINVAFYVPGSVARADWEGIRESSFSRSEQLLMLQVAVPPVSLESSKIREFIVESLHGANAVAFEFFRQQGLDFPLSHAEAMVLRIVAHLDGAASP